MTQKQINDKIKEINNEDCIWIIYIGIIILSWYSNSLERNYFKYNDLKSKDKYRESLIIIFSILIVVYLYFLKNSIKSIKKLKPNDSVNKKNLTYLSFLGSLLIAISGFIFLYLAYKDKSIEIELAFN
jgi:uncharacterized membrane protein